MMNALNKTLLSVSVALGLSACASVKTADTYDLDFSKQKYTEQSIEVNGQAVKFRAYEGVVYVRNPVDTRYEIINIYVPKNRPTPPWLPSPKATSSPPLAHAAGQNPPAKHPP